MESMNYTALEPIRCGRPVDRVGSIAKMVASKRIFDLGALDETAVEQKQGSGRWLHAELCRTAEWVVGVDNSARLPPEGLTTADNGRIIRADIFNLSPVIEEFGKPQALVAGELIEHLPSTMEWLRSLKENSLLEGAELIFSTPNACSWYNTLVGLVGRESTHPDHLQIYSYKTLCTLFDRSGLNLQTLTPYHARFDEMRHSSSGLKRGAVVAFQEAVNVLEKVSPLLSGGWIGRAII